MKISAWVNEVGVNAACKLTDSKNLEDYHAKVLPKPMAADCLQMVKL